ncbi:extracellular solute-binding protein [Thiospirochaeta perfilievii]|uniref:Extracellular solute-binding protein n=1 Tax=Thiospirochaeta perfilievii TaxID=252967 RepID=A0A5C1QBR1_9SPIO|nr:extracellular solute-binding protein [Thiospirochaeta perfilievii]QEN03632.1 extracellular solute-binding protein [Thiospirochaeta perfilievii]
MKIRNVVLMLMVALLTVGSAFASNNAETSEKVKLVVLGYGDASTPDGKQFQINIENFIAANPEIEVEWDMQYDELYHQKLQAMLAGGEQLDLAYMWNGGSRHQPVKDAGEEIDQLQFVDATQYDPAALIGGGANGELFSIPVSKGAHTVMYSNDDLLKELGLTVAKTYEEMLAQNEIAKAAGKFALAYPGATAWAHNTFVYSVLVGRFGGAQHAKDLIAKKAKFTDEPTVKAFEFIKKMYDDGLVTEDTLQADYGVSLAQFNNNEALYFIDGGWRAAQVTLPNFTWNKFFAVPGEVAPGSGNGGYSAGYSIMKSATLDPARKAAATKLLQYMTGEDASIVRALYSGAVPTFKVKGDIVYKEGTEPAAEYIASLSQITDTVGDYIDGTTNGHYCDGIIEIWLGTKTPMQLAEETQAIYEAN